MVLYKHMNELYNNYQLKILRISHQNKSNQILYFATLIILKKKKKMYTNTLLGNNEKNQLRSIDIQK